LVFARIGFYRIVRSSRSAHTFLFGREREPDMPIAATELEDLQQVASDQEATRPEGFDGADAPTLDDFEHIYATYNARVYYLCLRMTGNADDAEDLSQEAFLRLIQRMGTFRGESAFYTWLRRLAINVVLLRFQSASWRREISLEGLTDPDVAFGSPRPRELASVDLKLLGAIDRICLERAIDQLPAGFKAVFILHDIEGYEHTEISRLLGCSVGTSKSQLHKARLKMRELLGEACRGKAPRKSHENGAESGAKQALLPEKEPPVLQFPRPLPRKYDIPFAKTA
jgi:RNA polymerase sigma-70 factor, ECF subfamily